MIRFRFAFLLRTVSESLLRSGLRSNRRLVRFRSFFSRASFSCLTFCAHERAGNRIKLHQALPGLAFKIKTSKPVAGPPRVRLAEMPHSHQIDHVAMYSSANKHVFHSHQKKKKLPLSLLHAAQQLSMTPCFLLAFFKMDFKFLIS